MFDRPNRLKRRFLFGTALLSTTLFLFILLSGCSAHRKPKLRFSSIDVSGGYISPANHWQYTFDYIFHSYSGEFYIFDRQTENLFTYNDGLLNQIDFKTGNLKIWSGWFFDEWFCYCTPMDELYIFSLQTHETTIMKNAYFGTIIPNENNDLVSFGYSNGQYGFWQFSHNNITPRCIAEQIYRDERLVGETKYYCEYNASAMGTVGKYIDSREDVTVIEEEGKYYFYRLEDGRLLIFDMLDLLNRHDFIWIIDNDGEIYPILQIDGEVVHISYNISGEFIYYSFWRYEYAAEDLFDLPKKFHNDKLEGTWKMNVNTLETVKISNRIYESIFVLDNNVIGVGRNGVIRIIEA